MGTRNQLSEKKKRSYMSGSGKQPDSSKGSATPAPKPKATEPSVTPESPMILAFCPKLEAQKKQLHDNYPTGVSPANPAVGTYRCCTCGNEIGDNGNGMSHPHSKPEKEIQTQHG